jgi:NAD(P)-dependent dehydrogenase (short-subunit alcohol dehydrogenase family)
MTVEQWQQDIDVNLTGSFRTIQACLGMCASAVTVASW